MVQRWDIVVVGNLSRNRYWGEGEDRPVRPPLCTCTLVRGGGFHLLVDPSFEDARQMAAELDRRTGLKPEAIDHVFLTHEHGDHHAGLRHFPGAAWQAGPATAAALNASGRYSRAVQAVCGPLPGGIELLPTPGHTSGHSSLRFDCDGMSVVIAGDAAMTRDFWVDRRPFFNSVDPQRAFRSMQELAARADILVPGHDNYFPVLERER